MGKRYSSDKERFAAGVESLLRVAHKLGLRPERVSRDSWAANKRPGEIADKALRKAGLWAEVQQKASFCLPNGTGNQWPEDYSLEEALAEVRQVVYFKPRNLQPKKPKATPQPASADEMVDVFGKDLTIKNLRAEKRQLLKEIRDLQARFDLVVRVKEDSTKMPTLAQHVRTRTGLLRQGIAKVLVSDLHLEERISLEQTNGCNQYNPEIAKARLSKLAEGIVYKIETHRRMYDIKSLIMELLGDLITGYLHLDNLLTNYMSPFQAVLECKNVLIELLLLVLEEAKLEELIVNCLCGNHGRNFDKPVAKNMVYNSFEWLIFQIMKEQLAYEERIKFNIATGEHLYTKVFDQVHRGCHGTAITYRGGIGRATIPLYSALKEWDKLIRADMTCIGHLHIFLAHPTAIINGSICGYNEYALSKKCGFEEPQQAFMLVDSHRGVRDVVALWLSEKWDHKLKGEAE